MVSANEVLDHGHLGAVKLILNGGAPEQHGDTLMTDAQGEVTDRTRCRLAPVVIVCEATAACCVADDADLARHDRWGELACKLGHVRGLVHSLYRHSAVAAVARLDRQRAARGLKPLLAHHPLHRLICEVQPGW